MPCALLTIAAIVLLGGPLGHAFLGPGAETFWPKAWKQPEPAEHGRFLIALLGPVMLAAAVVVGTRRRVRLAPTTIRRLTRMSQATLVGVLAASLAAQNELVLRASNEFALPDRLFKPRTIAVALALALLVLVAPRRRELADRLVRASHETRQRRFGCLALAAAGTALWLLTAINTDATISHAYGTNLIPWDMNETFAVLDGRTPLVDFHAEYSQLLPYVAAATMALLGATIGVWTAFMTTTSGLALLAVYSVFRRIVRSSSLALVLFLPFLATGFFRWTGSAANRFSPASTFSVWPMRYAGPYLLAWLTVRHLSGLAPRRAWLLFTAAGLVAFNDSEFGAGAFGATLAALAVAMPSRSARATARLLGDAVLGLLAATLLITALTLVRSGALPKPALLLEFPRLYGIGGWALQRMPLMGFHIAIYLTLGAAIVVAIARAVSGGREVLLSATLAWSGIFGLGAGSYYAGRSEPLQLIALLSAWSLAVTLLTIVVVRGLAAHGWRRPSLAELAVLFGFGLAVCSLAQLPAPWLQLERLRDGTSSPMFRRAEFMKIVAGTAAPGEKVAIIAPLGHRVAYDLHLTNVSPYSGIESMPTRQQADEAIDVVRREGVHHVYLGIGDISPGNISTEVIEAFVRVGFAVQAREPELIALAGTVPPAR